MPDRFDKLRDGMEGEDLELELDLPEAYGEEEVDYGENDQLPEEAVPTTREQESHASPSSSPHRKRAEMYDERDYTTQGPRHYKRQNAGRPHRDRPYGDSRLPPRFPPGGDMNNVPGLQHPAMGLAGPQGGPPPPMMAGFGAGLPHQQAFFMQQQQMLLAQQQQALALRMMGAPAGMGMPGPLAMPGVQITGQQMPFVPPPRPSVPPPPAFAAPSAPVQPFPRPPTFPPSSARPLPPGRQMPDGRTPLDVPSARPIAPARSGPMTSSGDQHAVPRVKPSSEVSSKPPLEKDTEEEDAPPPLSEEEIERQKQRRLKEIAVARAKQDAENKRLAEERRKVLEAAKAASGGRQPTKELQSTAPLSLAEQMEVLKQKIREQEEKVKALRSGAVAHAAEISPGKTTQHAAEQPNGDELIQPATLQADVPGQDVVHEPRSSKAEDDNGASNLDSLELAPVLTEETPAASDKEANGDTGGGSSNPESASPAAD